MKYLCSMLAFILAGCTAPISANPKQDLMSAINLNLSANIVSQDLQDQAWNLHQAVAVGALSANDAAVPCVDKVLSDLGVTNTASGSAPTPPAASFTPKVSGVASLSAVIYIRAQQAKQLSGNGGLSIPTECYAIIGQFQVDAAKLALKTGVSLIPGTGVLQAIGPLAP